MTTQTQNQNQTQTEPKPTQTRIPDPGSTSPTYKPNGEPREWGDYGDDD